nr:DNA recombination/repair protein RecA [Cyclobacteriaceae bacterium]
WFSYNGNKLGQGRDTVKQLIEDNPELAEELENKIKEKIGVHPAEETAKKED